MYAIEKEPKRRRAMDDNNLQQSCSYETTSCTILRSTVVARADMNIMPFCDELMWKDAVACFVSLTLWSLLDLQTVLLAIYVALWRLRTYY